MSRAPGDRVWFEYHCLESHDSADAVAWYHSHQQVTVLAERDADEVAVYGVRFDDGVEWDVFEDELMADPAGFSRPDPPPDPKELV